MNIFITPSESSSAGVVGLRQYAKEGKCSYGSFVLEDLPKLEEDLTASLHAQFASFRNVSDC